MSDSNDTFENFDHTEISESQILKYAEDISSLVKSERIKRKALEITNKQL